MNKFNFVGHVILGVQIAADKSALRFDTDKGEVVACAEAECCSTTWIEDVSLPALGFPATVTKVSDLAMPASIEREDYLLQYYGYQIETTSGNLMIEYRNESNGYYGGSLVWPGHHYHHGRTEEWVDIKERT